MLIDSTIIKIVISTLNNRMGWYTVKSFSWTCTNPKHFCISRFHSLSLTHAQLYARAHTQAENMFPFLYQDIEQSFPFCRIIYYIFLKHLLTITLKYAVFIFIYVCVYMRNKRIWKKSWESWDLKYWCSIFRNIRQIRRYLYPLPLINFKEKVVAEAIRS